jgi:hypothetical protein
MTLQDQLARSRELARTAGDHAADMFSPLLTIGRGLRSHARWARSRWKDLPKDRRLPTLLIGTAIVGGVVMLPYGPLIAVVTLMASAAWAGRDRTPPEAPGPDSSDLRLGALYTALTPYLSHENDPEPLYRHGSGDDGVQNYKDAFTSWEFDEDGRLTDLDLKYPAYFTDTEPHARARIEHVIHGKAGRSREYRFTWELETNRLHAEALAPLPTDIAAQRFVTSPGEVVLGFTDPSSSSRSIPLRQGGGTEHQPPVLWRTGPRSTEPHLLALGAPGHGTSTLLRSIALQALTGGDLVMIDGAGTGEHACLVGRPGVHTVETSLHGALAALEWVGNEIQRRLDVLNEAKHTGGTPPADALRPLWLLLDHPSELSELAQAENRPDPQDLLDTALRHGRAARITVVVADHLDALERIKPTLRASCRARVALGALDPDAAPQALGTALDITPAQHTPPGRGYARIGNQPAVRLQVPETPDPLDEETSAELREAVIGLLPFHGSRTEASAHELSSAKEAKEAQEAQQAKEAEEAQDPADPEPAAEQSAEPELPEELAKEFDRLSLKQLPINEPEPDTARTRNLN